MHLRDDYAIYMAADKGGGRINATHWQLCKSEMQELQWIKKGRNKLPYVVREFIGMFLFV